MANIIVALRDQFTRQTDNMRNASQRFSSSMEDLKRKSEQYGIRLEDLAKMESKLQVELAGAKRELDQARRAYAETASAANSSALEQANAKYNRLTRSIADTRREINSTSQSMRGFREEIRRMDSESGGGGGQADVLGALGKAGLGQMAGTAAQDAAKAFIGSAFGGEAGGVISSALSGAISGAAMGSLAGPVGTAVGAAVGGTIGLIQGGTQVFKDRDEAFKTYYGGLYDQGQETLQASLESGTVSAAGREQDLRALGTLLDGDARAARAFQAELIEIGRTPPFSYDTVMSLSRSMLGLGLSTGEATGRISALGEAAAALGLNEGSVNSVVSYLESALAAGQMEGRVLKSLSKLGINAYGALAAEFGISEDEVAAQLSGLDVERAVGAIYAYMGEAFAGAADGLTGTYAGASGILDSFREDMDNAMGEGYNTLRSAGLRAEIDAYGGALGEAMGTLNTVIGGNRAYLENLGEQYRREALSAVLLGEDTSLYGTADAQKLQGMRAEFIGASARYEATGDREAALKMEQLSTDAQALATAVYESSGPYQEMVDAQTDSLAAIRDNTAGLEAATNAYRLQNARSLGIAAAGIAGVDLSGMRGVTASSAAQYYAEQKARGRKNAWGLDRVPYDDFPAVLHQGERVLTAAQARAQDRAGSGGAVLNINGPVTVREEADLARLAQEFARALVRAGMLREG